MQKILMSIMTLLTISCNSLKPIIVKQISFKYNRCRLYCYNPNSLKQIKDKKCGEEFVSGDYNINLCDGILGIDIKIYAEYLKPKIKENIQYCQDLQTDY